MSRSQAGQPEALLATRKSAPAVLFWRGSLGATRPRRWRPAPRPRGARVDLAASEHGPHDAPIFAISSGGRGGTVNVARRKKKSPRNQEPSRLSHHCRDYPASPRFSRRRRGRARAGTGNADGRDARRCREPDRSRADGARRGQRPRDQDARPVSLRIAGGHAARQAAVHHVGRAERLLLDDRFSACDRRRRRYSRRCRRSSWRARATASSSTRATLRCGIVTCGGLCPGHQQRRARAGAGADPRATASRRSSAFATASRGWSRASGTQPLRLDAGAGGVASTTRAARILGISRGSQDPARWSTTWRRWASTCCS